VSPLGTRQRKIINDWHLQTALFATTDIKGLFSAITNRH